MNASKKMEEHTSGMPDIMAAMRKQHPEKFLSEDLLFSHVRRGARIFIGTGCGEPQYLIKELIAYAEAHPESFIDAEVIQIWSLGVVPYADEKFKSHFRHNSFFVGNSTRSAVNAGRADYTPVFLSEVPDLFRRGLVPLDVALVQTSLPDSHGYLSLGVSVDIVKAAAEAASIVIAQVNANMPRVHGDSFIHINDVDLIVQHDEPLLEYLPEPDHGVADQIGKRVADLISDGDTIQVGYGSLGNAILANLRDKKHLGVHTELFSDGITDLINEGVIDNSLKNVNRGKTVAAFCMGTRRTYEFLNDNPTIEFRTVDYVNSPLVIAEQENMIAINSGLEIDLTGQATADSIGRRFYSGLGGQADFMRGAVLSKNGKSIFVIQSTAKNGTVSRIVPYLKEGAGCTLNRGDIHYVATEYGIAYLHGKNVRERAMDLISIAHPRFRPWLIEEAKKNHLIYPDQTFFSGKQGEYPADLEFSKIAKNGFEVFMRPVKISDEPLLKEFFYSLSDQSLYRRFFIRRPDLTHEHLQEFVVMDYSKDMAILAVNKGVKEEVVGIGQYETNPGECTAELSFVVKDGYQGRGIATELLTYLMYIGKRHGLLGFTAEVLKENAVMQNIFKKASFTEYPSDEAGVCKLRLMLGKKSPALELSPGINQQKVG